MLLFKGLAARKRLFLVLYPDGVQLNFTIYDKSFPLRGVAVVTSYLPARIFVGIDQQDLEKQSLYSIFEHTYKRKLQWAEELIGAVVAGEEEATVLQTSPGSALLLIKETTYDSQNVAIEYSVSLLRGDRYTASVISVRKS